MITNPLLDLLFLNVDVVVFPQLKVNELEQKLRDVEFQREKLEREKKRRCWGANLNNNAIDFSESDPST